MKTRCKYDWPPFDPIWYCLDDWDSAKLRHFWGDFHLAGEEQIRVLYPTDAPASTPELKKGLRKLATLAINKSSAIDLRLSGLDGKIARALAYEEFVDQLYSELPEWAQW